MGLIPKVDSLPNFCSQSLSQFQQYRCIELGAQAGEQTLSEVCEKHIGSMSAFIHNGAVGEYHLKVHHWYTQDSNSMLLYVYYVYLYKSTACNCHQVGAFSSSCSKFGGQCQCKPNVIGRCCDSCAPVTYGLGPNGCSRKPYSLMSSQAYCDNLYFKVDMK